MTARDSKFHAEVADLRTEMTNGFVLVLAVVSMTGMFLTLSFWSRSGELWPNAYMQSIMLAELCVLLLSMLYGWLHWLEHRRLATWLISWGLTILSFINMGIHPGVLSAVWVGVVCMLLALLFGPIAGWTGAIVLLALSILSPARTSVQALDVLAEMSPVVVLVALMQIVARVLFRNLRWMTESYEAVRRQSDEFRDQSAQLAAALKSLNQTSFALARTNEQLEVMVKFAEDARRAKQEFAANISHELRAPLNLIIGFSDVILFGTEHPERYEGYIPPPAWLADLHVIRRNAQQLFRLVNDILDLSQMDMNHMTIVRKPTDVRQFVHSALEELGPLISQRGLNLKVDIQPDLPEVYADQNRILQVLLNLINNALRFTDVGGITIRARGQHPTASSQNQDGEILAGSLEQQIESASRSEIVISVCDTGVGIAPGDLQRIFEPFAQAGSALARQRQGGSGLGLTISKRFVEMHGGRMWVESVVGQGSTFYFSLPLQPPMPPSGTSSMSREFRRREVGALAVVERTPLLSNLLARHLEGIDALYVPSMDDLVRLVERSAADCPEAVLLNEPPNANMPLPQWPAAMAHLPILRCYIPTAFDHGAMLMTGEAPDTLAAPYRYLSKPFTREQLYQSIGELLRSATDVVPCADGVARLLVVEDDDDTASLIGRLVRFMPSELRCGFRDIVTLDVHSGTQAIEFLRRLDAQDGNTDDADSVEGTSVPAVHGMLLDIRLGDMVGFDVLAELERHESLRSLPVCVMSGEAVGVGGGPLITPYITLARHDGLTARELVESVAALLDIMLPGVTMGLLPTEARQPTALRQTA